MGGFSVMYRDYDRTPYLYTLPWAAKSLGLEVDIQRAEGYDWAQLLRDGTVDFLAENYYGLQNHRARGAPFASVTSAVTWRNEKLLVAPEIGSVDDLRGKKLAIRGIGPSELGAKLWLKDRGLDQDVEAVVVPDKEMGRWGNWKKIVGGECHGGFVTNLHVDEAVDEGLKVLPLEPYGLIANVTLTTRTDVITERREEVATLVRAAFDTSSLFKDDASTTLEIMSREPMKLMEIESEQALERTYEILRDELSDVPVPSVEGVSNTRRMTLARSDELADFNPLLMWDLSFAGSILGER